MGGGTGSEQLIAGGQASFPFHNGASTENVYMIHQKNRRGWATALPTQRPGFDAQPGTPPKRRLKPEANTEKLKITTSGEGRGLFSSRDLSAPPDLIWKQLRSETSARDVRLILCENAPSS